MIDIYEQMLSRIEELNNLRNHTLERINSLNYKGVPKYHLRIEAKQNQLFLIEPGKRNKGKYVSPKDIEFAKEVAAYDYLTETIKRIDHELLQLEKMIKQLKTNTPESYYESLNPARQNLIVPIRLTDEQFVQQWKSQPYAGKGFDEDDNSEFYTENNERVRSKSEILIANALKKYNVPYKYECPIILKGVGRIHPDFTALNVRRRKICYWEHLGRMDEEDYARKNVFRINMYQKNGFFHGDNLITTWETSSLPLNTKLIDSIIQHFLL